MNPRRFTIIALFFLAPPAQATEGVSPIVSGTTWSCSANFASLGSFTPLDKDKAKAAEAVAAWEANLYSVPEGLSAEKIQLRKELTEFESKPAKDFFPNFFTNRAGKKLVTMNPTERDALRKYFDELWEKRVASGVIPKYELKRYRKWLKKDQPDGLSYPVIDSTALYSDYIEKGRPISEYLDDLFLNFVEKDHGLRAETLPQFLNSLEPEFRKYLVRSKLRDLRRVANGVKNTLVAAPITAVGIAAVGIWSGMFRSWFEKLQASAISGFHQTEDLLNRSIFAQRLQDTVDKLVIASQQLLSAKMGNGTSQATESEAIKVTQAALSAVAPSSYDALISSQPTFSADWRAKLDRFYLPLTAWQSTYSQLSQAQEELRSRVDRMSAEGKPISGNDLRRMADLASQMSGFEDQMANVLADYAFYRAFKAKDPIPDLVRQYEPVLQYYLENMNLSKFRDQFAARINDHALQIKSLIPPFTDSEKSEISKALEAKKQADHRAAELAKQRETDDETRAKQLLEQTQATIKAGGAVPPVAPAPKSR